MIFYGIAGKKYEISSTRLNGGGEGEIYNITNPKGFVAKIYFPNSITNEIEKKLLYMIKNPPSNNVLSQIAWPVDVLYNNTSFCGFVMNALGKYSELWELYSYPAREHKNITLKHKLIIAQNICCVITDVHKAGYVFGDFNPKNIGVDPAVGKVAFWDVDSYHFTDINNNRTYRCNVGAQGYIAPELITNLKPYGNNAYAIAPLPTFTKETDDFALAIHIFKLLMNGVSPYNGIKDNVTASQGSPGVGNSAIERDSYCFKKGNKPQSQIVPALDTLPKKIQSLFTRSFIDGRDYPQKRPTANDWLPALEEYEKSLIQCSKNVNHYYTAGLQSCPWCEADKKFLSPSKPKSLQRTYSPVKPVPVPIVTGTYNAANVQAPASFQNTRGGFFSNNVTYFFITTLIAGLFVYIAFTFIAPIFFTPRSETGIIGWWLNLVSTATPYLIIGAGLICPWIYQNKSIHDNDWHIGNYVLSALISIAGIVGISVVMSLLAIILPILIIVGIIIGLLSG